MAEYLGKVHGLLHDFNELLPPAATTAKELDQRQTFFMLMALYGLPDEYSSIRDQILGSPTVPTLNSAWSTLLRVPCKFSPDIPSSTPTGDSSALVSQRDDRQRSRKPGKGRPKCDHCHKLGHTIDRCYVLHGRPPRPATVVAHTASPVSTASGATPSDSSGSGPPALFNVFLKGYEDRQASDSTASVVHTGPSFVGLTHSTSLGPWVLDSGATDHISGNRSLFSSLSTFAYLPSITMTNGSRVTSHGVGTVHLSPSLSIDNVFYVLESPFNLLSLSRLTRSLDCLISFTKDSVFLQDRSSGRMIGTGCESHGLYHLRTSAPVGLVADSPSLIHAQLGHPSLVKLQQLVPRLSKLSHLSCESCQLGKHSRSSFSLSVPNRALSPFALVHSDIWGPSQVSSTLGFQYFVTFIDDYSQCTWLFLMKSCFELFSIFQSFYNEIQT
uniref:Retrovirus-related Pol polyprotein from transposon TNT 1-94 n=1 Tax=Cajanus cajan TaxID=3821 RepID=A0A151UCJ7_CAJCA|nr:Retrovirus-related Pol polyprotein from transposon TNT 1-94 [Cajanus cajan]